MFVERVRDFLKPGTGRAAVVLPDGILTNARTGYVREFMLENFQVLAIVSLPISAFMHYGAGVKASLVFVRRLADTEAPDLDLPVFLAEAAFVGYDATGRECPNELPEIAEQYRKFERDPRPFQVAIPELGALTPEPGDSGADVE